MSQQQLEDRIVSNCDLDERGTNVFDFGSRKFRLLLGPDMSPMVEELTASSKLICPSPRTRIMLRYPTRQWRRESC